MRGVVNGLWEFDVVRNEQRLKGTYAKASPSEARELATRYQVRVGIDRSIFVYKAAEIVVLPEGWTHSPKSLVDDGRTINIGDVIEMRGRVGTNFEIVQVIVRKCDEAPVPGENKDWNIGCRTIEAFDSRGYAGERYYLTGF